MRGWGLSEVGPTRSSSSSRPFPSTGQSVTAEREWWVGAGGRGWGRGGIGCWGQVVAHNRSPGMPGPGLSCLDPTPHPHPAPLFSFSGAHS